MLGEDRLQIETGQRVGAEVGGGDDTAVTHIAGEADRNSLEGAERRNCLVDCVDQIIGCDRLGRRWHALPLTDQFPGFIKQGGLDPGTADVDRKRTKLVHGSPIFSRR